MKLSKWVVSIPVLVLMMCLVSFKPLQSPVCSTVPVGYQGTDSVVLVAYQVWFGQEQTLHRCAFSGDPLLPDERPYNSLDREVIRRHIQEAKEKDIDGFVVDWYGPGAGVANDDERAFMDSATKILFEEAVELQDFYVALMYDDQTVKYAVPDDCDSYFSRVKEDLLYAKEQYFASPAYLKINECPALFIFPDDYVKPCLNWEAIKVHLEVPVTLLDRNPNPEGEPQYDANFEGFYAWVQADEWGDPKGWDWGEKYLEWFYETMNGVYIDKVAVGGVWPGFDDTLAPWSENRFMSRYQPGGLTSGLTLALAEDNNVEYILVGTWNDFEEGTDIEYDVPMLVDMEKPDPELLVRSSPVLVTWNSGIGRKPLQVYIGGQQMPIYDQEHDPGVYLSLTPHNIYELKLWTSGSTFLDKWVKIRGFDPVPDEDPLVVETETIMITSPCSGEEWQVNSSQTIRWTTTGEVGDVKIQFSRDNGCNWSTVTPSTANDGSFPWTLPNIEPGNKCLIRVSETDGVPAGTSAMFSIITRGITGILTLTSPNGGESWDTGSAQEVRWTTTGDINMVNIYISRDNGTTWKLISQNTPNDGSFVWVVRSGASDQCLIQVTASDSDLDPQPSDTSDAVFSIVHSVSPTLEVSSPNGGEQLIVGSLFTMVWETTGSRESVEIEYSNNCGQTWKEIASAAKNTGKYDWKVPDDPSNNCLVRVSETGGQSTDVSDAEFSIVAPAPGDITVTSPNGGESWPAGSAQEIQWTTSGGISNVTIEYSQDNGTTWQMIVQTTPNNSIYNWTVPDIASEECLVRITSNDALSDPKPSDVSDAVFSIPGSISPKLTVINPKGGEQLMVGSLFTINWKAINSREPVKIEYSATGGETWIIISDSTENNGKYDWLVPDDPSDACLVRISETNSQLMDISDAVFSIVQPSAGEIVVTSPNGGEYWVVGSLQVIKWTGSGGINYVTIDCSTDTGTTWHSIVQTTPNDGSFDWTIPDSISENCLVRVIANEGGGDPKPSDMSDQVFSIAPAGEFIVTSPNGGEEWEIGSPHVITWTGSGEFNTVMIEYSCDGGNTWNTIVSSAGNSGTYDWQVPDTISDECLMRVTANDGDSDPKLSDLSDSEFSIVGPKSPMIRVITPNGGEELIRGSIYEITWLGTNARAEIKIEYSINGGETWVEITGSTENEGEYDWMVPAEPSEICLIRISQPEGGPMDVSDAVFSIVSPLPGNLTLLTPNGGENLEAGSEYEITWAFVDLHYVILEYSVNNGDAWQYINKVPADNGWYTWTVPAIPSEECLVRISGADADENPSDVSDGVFNIFDASQTSIDVLTPNGGESLSVGEEYYITWASTGVENVLIEYSRDNGDEWITIATVPAMGGRFTWTVPDTPSSSCLTRITGIDSPEGPSDLSNATFSIISD